MSSYTFGSLVQTERQELGHAFGALSTDRQRGIVVLVFVLAQLFLYHDAFLVKPSADDFILASQIRVGEQTGPLTFFAHSPQSDYRPLQALTYWAVGRWGGDNPFTLIHFLNFVSFAFYAFVFVLWIRLCRLPLGAEVSAIGILFFHPVLAGPLADLDGFSRFVASGWVWLGAYFAFTYADRLWRAICLTSICCLVGLGFLEYAAAVVPLSILAIWWGRRGERLVATLAVSLVLSLLLVGYYLVRLSVIGPDQGHLSTSPIGWATNTALLATGVLFFGDTVSVYVERDGMLVAAAVSLALIGCMVLGGLWLWHRAQQHQPPANGEAVPTANTLRFLAAAVFASFLPMIFRTHVSEIYATPIVFSFALLTGFATAGWAGTSRRYFLGWLIVLGLHAVWAGTSVHAKVAGIRDTGERAAQQIQDLLGWIPAEAHDLRIALVFIESELPLRRTYSVFRGGDDHLIQPDGPARAAMEWFRPGQNITLVHLIVQDKSAVQVQDFHMVLYWNPLTRRFEPWKRDVVVLHRAQPVATLQQHTVRER